jgi:long-chain acyl-CoA synthetase
MILHASFDADRVLDDVAHKDVSIVFGVPMMFAALVQNPRTRRTDWSRVRIRGSGGSPLSAEIFSDFRECTGLDIREGYSLREISAFIRCSGRTMMASPHRMSAMPV